MIRFSFEQDCAAKKIYMFIYDRIIDRIKVHLKLNGGTNSPFMLSEVIRRSSNR